jgi:hypothetical protein
MLFVAFCCLESHCGAAAAGTGGPGGYTDRVMLFVAFCCLESRCGAAAAGETGVYTDRVMLFVAFCCLESLRGAGMAAGAVAAWGWWGESRAT